MAYFQQLLSNGSTTNAIGNYSGAPETFELTVPSGNILYCRRIRVSVVFTNKTDVLDYGPVSDGLTNGIKMQIVRANGKIINLTPEGPIKTNADLGSFGTNTDFLQASEAQNQNDQAFVVSILEMDRVLSPTRNERPLGMELSEGAKIQAILNDDFATPNILRQTFQVMGDMR